jgi:hypothetical protein
MDPKVRDIASLVLMFLGVGVISFTAARVHEEARHARDIATETQLANAQMKQAIATLKDVETDVRPKAEPTVVEGLKNFTYTCAASGAAAECTLTNPTKTLLRVCLRGVVHRKNSSATTESVVVCTGEVHPKETKAVSAPFEVGAVRNLCPGEYNSVKWDDCGFEMLDVTDIINKAQGA